MLAILITTTRVFQFNAAKLIDQDTEKKIGKIVLKIHLYTNLHCLIGFGQRQSLHKIDKGWHHDYI